MARPLFRTLLRPLSRLTHAALSLAVMLAGLAACFGLPSPAAAFDDARLARPALDVPGPGLDRRQ